MVVERYKKLLVSPINLYLADFVFAVEGICMLVIHKLTLKWQIISRKSSCNKNWTYVRLCHTNVSHLLLNSPLPLCWRSKDIINPWYCCRVIFVLNEGCLWDSYLCCYQCSQSGQEWPASTQAGWLWRLQTLRKTNILWENFRVVACL